MRLQTVGSGYTAPINKTKYNNRIRSYNLQATQHDNIVNFKGREDHVIFYGAEFPDYNKKGGVANVMGYYEKLPDVEAVIVQPYYNARKDYNLYGKYTGSVMPWQFGNNCKYEGLKNQYFFLKLDTDKKNSAFETSTNLDNNIASKNIIVLKEVASKKVEYGKQPEQEIRLFKVMNAVPVKNNNDIIIDYTLEELPKSNDGKTRNHFLIYSKGTAEFKEPYDDGSYNSDKKSNPEAFSRFKPQPYAENNRAFVDLKKELCDAVRTSDGSKFEPGTVVCSDSQTAYTLSFMRDEAVKGNPAFLPKDIAPSYVIHNLRAGYTGECGGLDLALNLGLTKEEIELMQQDPDFIYAEENGTLNEYFATYIPELRDFSGSFTPTLIAFHLREHSYATGLNTVSEGYAYDIANNNNIPSTLRGDWKRLYDNKLATGIMNPFEDPDFHIFKGVLGMKGFLEDDVNDIKEKLINMGGKYATLAEEIHPFENIDETKFSKDGDRYIVTEEAYNHYLEKKNINKLEFLNRLTDKFDTLKEVNKDIYNTLITGLPNKNVNLIGRIDKNLLTTPEKANKLKVYVSWGRLDAQKSPDIVMDAFDMFCEAHPEEAENSILILGGEAPDTEYSKKILTQANKMADKYKGHFAFMEAFAPNKILAFIADMALLPSREAPCELTDIETMRFMALLTATNAQGMADKNFDPDIESERDLATSFKTPSGYYISEKQIEDFQQFDIGEKYIEERDKLRKQINTEMVNRSMSAFEKKNNQNISLDKYIDANPEHKKVMNDLIDKYRSLILATGVFTCMERGLALTKAQRIKMAENELNIKTGWSNNQLLTKLNKPSAELYKDIFRSHAPTDTSCYNTSFLKKFRDHLQTLRKPDSTIVTIQKKQSFIGKYGKIIGWSALSALIIGGLAYYMGSEARNSYSVTGLPQRKHPSTKPRLNTTA